MKAQAWTNEPSAVRALTALGITHPEEFGEILGDCIGTELGPVDPASMRREDKHTDLHFSTKSGLDVYVEAKIDDFVSVEQLDTYSLEFSEAIAVVLVPSLQAPDVQAVLKERPSVRAIAWGELLARLTEVNPLAEQLAADIDRLAQLPGSKARIRKLLSEASSKSKHSAEVSVKLAHTGSRFPCLDITVPGTWVFGQVEANRDAQRSPRFHVTIGFKVDDDDVSNPESNQRMHDALSAAWDEAERLEAQRGVPLSRHGSRSPQQETFGMDAPYQARGFRGSHVGFVTQATEDPAEALEWAVELAVEFARISQRVWAPSDN